VIKRHQRRVYSNLPFTRGYVHFNNRNHATIKYSQGPDSIRYWDNLSFDGPVIPTPRANEIPDNTTTLPNDFEDAGAPDPSPAVNLGYLLLDGTTGKACGMCDPVDKVNALTFQNVNISGITHATLTLNAYVNASTHTADTTWGIQYRFNGGTWRTYNLTQGDLTTINNPAGSGQLGMLSLVISVPTTDLVQGNNTIKFLPVNDPMDYLPVITNIDVLVQ
jgi:hypothetical protein